MSKDSKPSVAPALSRRTVFLGAGAAGAVGVIAAATAASGKPPVPMPAALAQAATTGGYQLTEHVKQYYATARV